MALTLMIDGVDHISELVHESLIVNQTRDGLNSTCQFDIRDAGVIEKDAWTVGVTRVEDGDVITGHTTFSDTKVEVSVVDGGTVYFAGILSRIAVRPVGQVEKNPYLQPEVQILRCSCHDFNQILEESIVDELEEYTFIADGGGAGIIDDLFPKYVTGIDFTTHVDAVWAFKAISFEDVTIRQMLDKLATRSGAVWYVDYSKKLHYQAAGVDAPAWHLSDVPDDVNSFSYFADIKKEEDATNLVNMVFIIGADESTWFTDAASRAQYGDHKAIIRDSSLVRWQSVEIRGTEILEKFKDPVITYRVKTHKDGLHAGMYVRLVCAYYDVDAQFLISRLSITFPVDGEPVYDLTLGGLESSMGASAQRLIQDAIHDPQPIIPAQLPLASRGWGHDLVFTSTDHNTVAWDGGTFTTASGQDFAIAAGNTDDPGAMTEKTIVYLDTAISVTELQMTTDETAALGYMRIMVAVCWPGIVAAGDQPEVKAGFQVFGATGEVATFLNATNIIANAITANEIYCNTLSSIVADMGILNAGEIRMYANVWDVNANGFRLNADEIAGQKAGADTFVLTEDGIVMTAGSITFDTAAGKVIISSGGIGAYGPLPAETLQVHIKTLDGKLYAGAGAVRLDNEGVTLLGLGSGRIVRFKYDDAGTERLMGQLYTGWGGGGADPLATFFTVRREAGAPWPANIQVALAAVDEIAATDVRLRVFSGGIVDITGSTHFKANAAIWAATTVRAGFDDDWKLGDYTAGVRTDTGFIDVEINGSSYRLLCEAI